ncbi:MAG: DUF3598 family protein [Halothece sp. Uz-M2-17]|nr:DUF3598 family protein [Halothece sp. Uz-M2-17]
MTQQWNNLLTHLGVWEGSFTRLSPQGDIIEDTPSVVSLEGLNEQQTVRQTIEKFSALGEEATSKQSMEYQSLNRNTLVFENGAFSVGSSQFSPFSEFGAELGFLKRDARLRLVPLYNQQSQLSSITLIREHRQGVTVEPSSPLTVEQLLGEWRGEAITLYPDLRPRETYNTQLNITQQGNQLQQTLKTDQWEFTSAATITDRALRFSQGAQTVQVLLLPGGASCTTPLKIENRQPFFLEGGWLVDATYRQRLIRRYDERGTWVSLTLIVEHKIS